MCLWFVASSLVLKLNYYFEFIGVCVYTCAVSPVWRSENNLQDLVFLLQWILGIELRSSGLEAIALLGSDI